MHTKYCPHCGSTKIHKVYEEKEIVIEGGTYQLVTHYHECEDCNETWEHHK
jgi:hypothetical protein